MSSVEENNSKHENDTMKNGGSDKPLLESNGKELNDVNNVSEIRETHEMANLRESSGSNKEDMAIAVDEETPIDADAAVVKKRKGFDLRCLLIGLMVIIVMIGSAAIAILAHKSQSEANFDFRFANYFGHDMVLQRSPYRAVVWGYASVISENSTVEVRVRGQGVDQVYQAVVKSTAAGHTWAVQLDPRTETTPFGITAKIEDKTTGTNEIELKNVFFGDVWICAGDEHLDVDENHVASNSDELNDNVRILSLNPSRSEMPWYNVRNLRHSWSKPTKDVVAQASAMCWRFAKRLAEEQHRPVGIINVMYPSTFIYEWAPLGVVEKCDNINSYNARSSQIWNAMIHPLLEAPLFGVVWSQGRSDALEDSHSYNCTLVEMISHWRKETSKHAQSNGSLNLKFAVVQLAPSNTTTQYSYGYSDLRWRQTANFGYLPNTLIPNSFLVPTIDLPYSDAPQKKSENQDILVERLVREALSSMDASSIIPSKYFIDLRNDSLSLIFESSKITARNGPGFEVCCSENRSLSCSSSFVKVSYAPGREWVEAQIIRSSANSVMLNTENCKSYIVGVRYLWREIPCEDQSCPIRGEELNIPMSPYIKFDLRDDGLTHDLLRDQVHLM